MKARARLVGAFKSDVDDARGHHLVTDMPAALGGGDEGPTALELCVMSLAGCIATIWAIVARNSKVEYRSFCVDVHASKPEGARTIQQASVVATVDSDESDERLDRILEKTVKACPVGVLLEQAGVPVEHQVKRP